uniref:J domain-containing protein n=1 Tax=Coccolithus braarudii TaxID=221442 RepID=A0A7S0L1G1_9EUKA|mmetsp:Transcript_14978/g.32515  ORF Transcript_14978/g.32515 Transcript_14978/m.32515 type:complete len:254 (+) Transcript_14978:140-901(+)
MLAVDSSVPPSDAAASGATCKSDVPASLYSVLGVEREASAADIRKAYHKAALLNHPDKNPGDRLAEGRFLAVARAYEVLSDEVQRGRYDRGGGEDTYEDFDLRRANDLFNEHFTQTLMRQWSPGLRVAGVLASNGVRVRITIEPDGTVEEAESPAASSWWVSYLATTTTLPNGGRVHSLRLTTLLGENLAMLVPTVVAGLPRLGSVVTSLVRWIPSVAAGCLVLRLLRGRSRVPGELPDTLLEAFRLSDLGTQ